MGANRTNVWDLSCVVIRFAKVAIFYESVRLYLDERYVDR